SKHRRSNEGLVQVPGMNKILPLDELAVQVAAYKAAGKRVALCHGCFDLLHLGHMKHFEAAKKDADVLIVTVTPDRFVNKGPGRPVFTEVLRMEAIAALGAVDHVGLNKWETAIETIKLLKPDLYVKGQDYKDRSKDVTGMSAKEEEAAISVGGRLHFTEEIQFSSSSLINAHFSPLDDSVQSFLADFRKKFDADKVIADLESLKKLKVLVIGDTIIDEYHYCRPLGKSSKSPTISSILLREEAYAGGVLAIANHMEQFAGSVDLVTCLGAKDDRRAMIEEKLSPGVERNFFVRADGPTPIKRRYLDHYLNIKLFEVTFMNDEPISGSLEAEVIASLKKKLDACDMVVVADFGHGMLSPGIIDVLQKSGKYLVVNAQTNSNNYGFNYITKYARTDYISIDEAELRLPFGAKNDALDGLIDRLQDITHADEVQITLGQRGSIYRRGKEQWLTPAFATRVKDSVGAGDAVLSVTALCAKAGLDPAVIGFVGNCTGSLAVEIIGNEHPVYKKDLLKFVKHLLK
ncbi:MAG TPA: PfkB family carbohydrate kinase, partial [Flavobacteriales bacterium]|nr:PfkB family carbohydrate kinase [Flavobacteriales bacterium]